MKKWYSIYQFSSAERVGLLALISLIILLSIGYYALSSKLATLAEHQDYTKDSLVLQLQHQMDSLKKDKQEQSVYKIYPFNPNYLTEYKAYRLGMSAQEYQRILDYRARNLWINSASDFKRVTKVNDSLLSVIKPYLKFPDWVVKQRNKKQASQSAVSKTVKQPVAEETIIKDINTATKEELMSINGIGDKLSGRIIKYRNLLQGFTYNDQVYEVWHLDKSVANEVLKRFKVLSKPNIKKINVNTATFKEVLHSSPYIDYKLTKQIFDYKYAAGKILSINHLKKLDSFPVEKFERISLYLTAE